MGKCHGCETNGSLRSVDLAHSDSPEARESFGLEATSQHNECAGWPKSLPRLAYSSSRLACWCERVVPVHSASKMPICLFKAAGRIFSHTKDVLRVLDELNLAYLGTQSPDRIMAPNCVNTIELVAISQNFHIKHHHTRQE